MHSEIKTLQQIRAETPGLNRPGSWLVINVEPRMSWPTTAQSFQFEGHEIWLVPVTESAYPGLAVRNPTTERNEAYAMLYRALSVISWYEDAGATVESRGGGSPLFPAYGGNSRVNFIQHHTFDLTDLPTIENEAAKLALALLREGRGLNHPAYSFLSFYRVIERAIPDGKARGVWMSEAVNRINDRRAKDALAELKQHYAGDVGEHLYDSGRSAVAHATKIPVANPDNPTDYERLRNEEPIIEALAVMAIEEVFKIKTRHTIWLEHLYELKGWRKIFGDQLVRKIEAGLEPDEGRMLDMPIINVRLRESAPFSELESLHPIGWAVHDAKGEVQYRSRDGYALISFLLDFKDERLILSLGGGIKFADDSSVEAARAGKCLAEFVQAYLLNGELQIWNAEDGTLISKCDAFLPTNVIFNPAGAKAELEAWDVEIAKRSTASN